ncbi:MAG: GNAT family N-acetyltransferase [Gaiellaceae bacterium]
MTIRARPYETDDDLRRMQSLTQELWAERGPYVATHVGDLAWWLHRPEGKRRLWLDGERCVAWAWLHPPATLDYELRHADVGGKLHDEVLAWLEAETEGDVLSTYALETDAERVAYVEARGYARPESPKSYAFHLRELDDALPEPSVPSGFRLRTVEDEEDFRKRVEIHLAVWAPSRVTEEIYRRVTQAWPYRAELDCVVEAPDGRFAAYVLCWYDDANRVGLFEPVGTHPDFRRLGLGSAACRFALRRLREEGATRALVLAAEEPAMRLYESVGFERYTRIAEFQRPRA